MATMLFHPVARAEKKKWDFNINMGEYYGAALLGVIAIFAIMHWTRFFFKKCHLSPGSPLGAVANPIVSLSRRARKILLRPIPIYPTAGHALVVAIYYIITILLCVVRFDRSSLEDWGKRTGWVMTVNVVFLVVLSMRNGPIGLLSGYTYERLQVLHRTAGYTTIILMIMHMAFYTADYIYEDQAQKLIAKNIVMGIVSGCAMLVMGILALVLRRRQYELFYVTHVALFIICVATMYRHRPLWRRHLPQATLFGICIWSLDRLIRGSRLALNAINNTATVTIMPYGDGTRIIMKKRLLGARAGQHCFVWIPRVRAFETHPFTIVSNGANGLELIAGTHGGFTKSLQKFASKAQSSGNNTVWASVDGPYGVFPDLDSFDRVILVAGGSGATFTFGLGVHLVENMKPNSQQKVDFIWAIKKNERLAWFAPHIGILNGYDAHVDMTVHVTDDTPPSPSSDSERSLYKKDEGPAAATATPITTEKVNRDADGMTTASSPSDDEKRNIQEQAPGVAEHLGIKNVRYEKLLVAESIHRIVATVGDSQRVLIAACGPTALMKAVQQATADCIRPDGPSIELHSESFEW